MSFADELLADLGGDDGYESDPQEEEGQGGPAGDVKVEAMEEDEDTFAIPTGLPNKGKGKRKFDDLGDEEEDGGGGGGQDATLSVPSGGTRPADEMDKDDVEKMELVDVEDVRSVAKLWYSKSTKECLQVGRTFHLSSRIQPHSVARIDPNFRHPLLGGLASRPAIESGVLLRAGAITRYGPFGRLGRIQVDRRSQQPCRQD